MLPTNVISKDSKGEKLIDKTPRVPIELPQNEISSENLELVRLR